MRRAALFTGLLLASVAAPGCNFDRAENPSACRVGMNDCQRGERCVQGFCLLAEGSSDAGPGGGGDADAATGNDAGSDAGGGQTGTPCDEGTPTEPCYDGAATTADVGICRGGERACVGGTFTQCLGQVLPGEEDCNERDDDCDGTVDEIAMTQSCDTHQNGICGMGALVCRGSFAVCEPQMLAVEETCNGSDDDCDDQTDEIVAVECFPPGAAGCTLNSSGVLECNGLCKPGHTTCEDGQGQCADAVVAAVADDCGGSGSTAADEDCDLSIDEMCPCSTGQTRECYGGPDGTENNGACHAGTQACVSGFWGDCENQVLPGTETCLNMGVDDDCDGTRDDIQQLGDDCIDDTKFGICRNGTRQCQNNVEQPVCVTAEPQPEICDEINQDCDPLEDTFGDLSTDANCGGCGNRCDNGAHCCDFRCRAPDEFTHDDANCGGCGIACGEGSSCCWNDCVPNFKGSPSCECREDCRDLTCCGDGCADLNNDDYNCGACGNDCTRGIIRQYCCQGRCTFGPCAVDQ